MRNLIIAFAIIIFLIFYKRFAPTRAIAKQLLYLLTVVLASATSYCIYMLIYEKESVGVQNEAGFFIVVASAIAGVIATGVAFYAAIKARKMT